MLTAVQNAFLSQFLPTFFCVLSLGSSISLLATYRKFLRVRMRSGVLIILISICEFIMTLCWLLSLYYSTKLASSSTFLITNSACFGIGIIQVFSYLLYLFLNLCLIHTFALTTKDGVLNPPSRLKKFIWVSVIAALALTLAAALTKGIMESPYGFCGATAKSIIQYLSFIWLFIVDPAVLIILFRFYKQEREWFTDLNTGLVDTYTREIRKSFIKTNTGSILLFVVGWSLFHLLNVLFFLGVDANESMPLDFFIVMSFYAIMLTSFFMMLIRLTDPLLKKVIRRFVRSQLQPQQNDIAKFLLAEPTNSAFFTDMNQSSIKLRDASETSLGKEGVAIHSEIPIDKPEPLQRDYTDYRRENSLAMGGAITLEDYRMILHCLEKLINIDPASVEKPENVGQIPWSYYFYTHVASKKLEPLNNSIINMQLNPMESGTPEDFVYAYVHGESVFEHLAYLCGLKREEIIESISLGANEKNLQENYQGVVQKVGFYKNYHFKSADEKILFQILDKEQKFNILENYLQMYHEHVVSDQGNLLPQLLGLYTIDLVKKKYIVLLQKNSYNIFNETNERKLIVKKRILIDADFIRIEVLNSNGSIQSRNKIQVMKEGNQHGPEIEKLIEMAPEDRARLLDIMRTNLKFLDKAHLAGYKIVFILSSLSLQDRLGYEKPKGTDNNTFIAHLKTVSGDKISVFYELSNYFKPNPRAMSQSNAVFSKEDPSIYRQCIDETLYQYL